MPDELSELQENAEHGRENPSLAPISVTMAILAVCVAVVSLMGHRSHTEELLMQSRATDQWAYYQAKNIRRHSYEMELDHAFPDGIQGQGAGRESPRKISSRKPNATRRNRRKSKSRPRISKRNPRTRRSERRPIRSRGSVS